MKCYIAVVTLLALLTPAIAMSGTVTREEAQAIGANFIEFMIDLKGGWGASESAEVTSVNELRRGDLLLGYHLSVAPSGHIVVPSVRMLSPVKSFSFHDDFETEAEVGYWQLLKDAMEYSLQAIEEHHGPMDLLETATVPERMAENWNQLLEGGMAPASVDTVGPLMKTHWDQGDPYNDNCPMGDGGRCVVGCVATAGSQTMRYWKHPSHGTGSHSYWWNGDQSCGGSTSGKMLSASFDHAYDWSNILRRYIIGYDSTEAAAVAELCSDVGIAWEMDYGRCGSGAYTARGLTVYPTWFKYLDTIARHNRSDYGSAEAWFAVIKAEFDADPPRVIHYRIHGHSINCDGYIDADINYIHLNYGWGGSSDDWYAVDSLYCPWSGCDPMVEYMLCGIEPGADFIDATTGPLGDGGDTYGVAWGDYDDDDDDDIYIVNDGGANRLLRNDGGGAFTDVTADPLGDTGHGRAASFADLDHDGDLDIYLCNTSGEANKLFRNDGGTFTDVTGGPLGDTGNSEAAAWLDYDFDGDLDIYVVNNGSANVLLENTGGGIFIDASASPVDDAGNGYSAAPADCDGDGDTDIYLVNDGANRLFRNDGGSFTDVTTSPLNDSGNGRGAAWADYDNDGDMDLYLSNRGSANKLFRNDGTGFADATTGPLGDAGNGTGVAWGDWSNDGDLDIYLVNDGGANKILRNRGGGDFQDATVTPLGDGGNGKGAAVADFDGDGLVDIYVANTGGANVLLHNQYQPKTRWLQVELVGTTSNTTAVGSRVRVVTGGLTQTREITAGSGYCSQNSALMEFGLRDSTVIDTLEITWPTGMVWDTTTVSADQRLTFYEYDISGVSKRTGTGDEFSLHACRPNPFDETTLIRYTLGDRSKVRIMVYDVTGKTVRTLVNSEAQVPGDHTVSWDGRNEHGARVSSGIYFYRLETGSFKATRRMALLR
jgi:hypothetical protein